MTNFFRLSLVALAIAAAFSTPSGAYAQAEVPAKTSAAETSGGHEDAIETPSLKKTPAVKRAESAVKDDVQQVTITGGRQSDVDARRLSTAGKIIFGREELDRNGDSSIGEILKRLPGVTVSGRAGRGGDIRMRGMGSGYTQILINGERAPIGFSMDSLSPEQVERIEVMRGPVAEYSTQAIAGTINIVLREEYKQKDIELKISESFEQGRSAPTISLTYPGHLGEFSYALSGSIFRNHQRDEVATHTSEKDSLGHAILEQDLLDVTHRESTGIHFTPRFNYRFENGDTLMLQLFMMNSRSNSRTSSNLDQTGGAQEYALANSVGDAETTLVRGFGNWQHKFEDNAKLNIKFGGAVSKMDSASLRSEYGNDGRFLKSIIDTSATNDRSLNAGGKITRPIGDGHTLALGLELENGKRNQTKASLDDKGAAQFSDSGDNLTASTRRLAAFVQDEFDINAQWSAYAGLRWEGIHTSSSTASNVVENASSVWSPVLHAVWRLPDGSKDQVRMSLTSSYRAPVLNDLIVLPSISPLNGPTKPDRTGNPLLKPELSKGIDLAYEHYLTRAGIMSVNLFVRSIDDLMRRQTELVATSTGPRWVSSPVNIGHAMTRGVELEAKFQLQEFFPEGPAIDLRTNYSHFWSSVDDIVGPNNRLDQQPAQTGNFGLDYRAAGLPLTLGGNINWTPAYVTQASDTQINSTGIKRQLDVYGLWKFSPGMQLRLSANNLQADDSWSGSAVTTAGINHVQSSNAKTYTTWTLKMEMKI